MKPEHMSETFIGEAHDGVPESYNYVRLISKKVWVSDLDISE